ncbi:cytochrome D1 domain-containing protein [Rhodovibrionaceae bacterium A322]
MIPFVLLALVPVLFGLAGPAVQPAAAQSQTPAVRQSPAVHPSPDGRTLYLDNCADCHGEERLGNSGPALLPQSLKRLRGTKLEQVIARGRPLTQMPGFSDSLSAEETQSLASYLRQPPKVIPGWDKADITASRSFMDDYKAADAPVFEADPLNITLVVETGDHHVTVLDGDKMEPLDRFRTHYAVHGGPKFTPDGRYVFIMSRDGWVLKYDIWSLQPVAEVRAGINSRNIAISSDGKHLAVANYLPTSLVILSTDDFSVEKIFDVRDKDGTTSRVSAVYQAPNRKSFIAALKDVSEIWEIATSPEGEAVYEGFVHSYEKGMVEALASSEGLFALRRIKTSRPLDDFFFTPDYRHLVGASRSDDSGVVVNLNVGREIAELPLGGMPHLGSGISWMREGRRIMATPHLRGAKLSVIDIETWELIDSIPTEGPGFFLRSHENSDYAWTDIFFGPKKDVMHVIDKQSLKIVKSLRPAPGKTVAHVEFDRYGRYALVSVWEDEGEIIVYDAKSLEEIKRLPMRKPSGKYNVWNKIKFSEGTSH